ncbi:MAG: hypothetical protein DRJ40_07325 [Thermoprotei archaeon]|nr:MAG: hypothetical protein DRJ40_07325 [Thermoprotei archaeon]
MSEELIEALTSGNILRLTRLQYGEARKIATLLFICDRYNLQDLRDSFIIPYLELRLAEGGRGYSALLSFAKFFRTITHVMGRKRFIPVGREEEIEEE